MTRPIYTDESLDRFGTIAFGIETMTRMIAPKTAHEGVIDAVAWSAVVPSCYWPAVHEIMERVFERHVGGHLTAASVLHFVEDLNMEIAASLTPVAAVPSGGR